MSEDWEARRQEVRRIVDLAVAWARSDPTILAVGLAGSEARGEARLDSDVDLVVLVEHPERWLEDSTWYSVFGDDQLVRAEQFGALAERRLRLPSGLDVEVGIVPPSWAKIDPVDPVDPVDPETRRVVRDGFRILYEQDDTLTGLVRRVSASSP